MQKEKLKFLLVSTIPKKMTDEEAFKDIKELKLLVDTYGGEVTDIVTQRREVHDKGMYIGSGKIDEIGNIILSKQIDVVVLNAIVNPGHIYEMYNIFYPCNKEIQVWDRVDLILKIFASHAKTAEARLQIQLAAMRHMGPRIYGMGKEMSQQGGGIGARGIGETNTELMKRHWRSQMKIVQDKLTKLSQDRERQMNRRAEMGLKTVSIIGYTNAGKTSLFNSLTGKENIIQNALFVTLDSSIGKIKLPKSKDDILISDTIGFIQNLPPDLIDAFASTLMESTHANLLLHVIDASDQDFARKIDTVEDVLYQLRLSVKKRIYLFNKVDQIEYGHQEKLKRTYKNFNPHFISVKKGEGIAQVLEIIEREVY